MLYSVPQPSAQCSNEKKSFSCAKHLQFCAVWLKYLGHTKKRGNLSGTLGIGIFMTELGGTVKVEIPKEKRTLQ